MDTEKHELPLEKIPANRQLVEELYSHGKITWEAREYALSLLFPNRRWGLWISRLLSTIGTALILAGIIYFFAFNWVKITPAVKLISIQVGFIACLVGAYSYSLKRLSGKLLLLSASVLVGVFMAVFGQIYQTGADSYELFMMWSLLTLGWTLISKFPPQWIFWLIITNIFLVLWWLQSALPTDEMEFMIFTYMTVFNSIALALREYFVVVKGYKYLEARWTRALLIIATLIIMLIPIIFLIFEPSDATKSIVISAVVGFIGHGIAFFIYRDKLRDMWSLSAVVLSGCIILETTFIKIVSEIIDVDSVSYLLLGLFTITLFTCSITYLRKIAKNMEVDYV